MRIVRLKFAHDKAYDTAAAAVASGRVEDRRFRTVSDGAVSGGKVVGIRWGDISLALRLDSGMELQIEAMDNRIDVVAKREPGEWGGDALPPVVECHYGGEVELFDRKSLGSKLIGKVISGLDFRDREVWIFLVGENWCFGCIAARDIRGGSPFLYSEVDT